MNVRATLGGIVVLSCLILPGIVSARVQDDGEFLRLDGMLVDKLLSSGKNEAEASFFWTHTLASDGETNTPISRSGLITITPFTNLIERPWVFMPRAEQHIRMAESYILREQWQYAYAEIEAALRLEPMNLAYLKRAAAVQAIMRNYEEADAYFRKCVQMDPEDIPFLVGWAGVLLRLKRFPQAEKILQQAHDYDPNYMTGRFNEALLDLALKRPVRDPGYWKEIDIQGIGDIAAWIQGDKEDLKKVLGSEGLARFSDVVLGRGTLEKTETIRTLARKLRWARSQENWRDVRRLSVELAQTGVLSFWPIVYLAESQYRLGQSHKAYALLQKVCDRYPESVFAWYNLGYVAMGMSKYQDAIRALERAAQLEENRAEVNFALACAYSALDRLDEAWPLLKKMATGQPDRLKLWLTGNASYIVNIRQDERYGSLQEEIERNLLREENPIEAGAEGKE